MMRFIGQGWLVIVLSLGFGGALAAVQLVLAERIAVNKQAATLAQIPKLVPGSRETQQDTIQGKTVYRALADGRQLGWVVPASGQGFADRIELLIGLDPKAETLKGIFVLEQKETPGLGNKIEAASWRDQFKGRLTLKPFSVFTHGRRPENSIDAITGATISSESVCSIINRTVATMGGALAAKKRN